MAPKEKKMLVTELKEALQLLDDIRFDVSATPGTTDAERDHFNKKIDEISKEIHQQRLDNKSSILKRIRTSIGTLPQSIQTQNALLSIQSKIRTVEWNWASVSEKAIEKAKARADLEQASYQSMRSSAEIHFSPNAFSGTNFAPPGQYSGNLSPMTSTLAFYGPGRGNYAATQGNLGSSQPHFQYGHSTSGGAYTNLNSPPYGSGPYQNQTWSNSVPGPNAYALQNQGQASYTQGQMQFSGYPGTATQQNLGNKSSRHSTNSGSSRGSDTGHSISSNNQEIFVPPNPSESIPSQRRTHARSETFGMSIAPFVPQQTGSPVTSLSSNNRSFHSSSHGSNRSSMASGPHSSHSSANDYPSSHNTHSSSRGSNRSSMASGSRSSHSSRNDSSSSHGSRNSAPFGNHSQQSLGSQLATGQFGQYSSAAPDNDPYGGGGYH